MFKIEKNPHFTHEVTVMTPVDNGHREDTFKARFKVQSVAFVEGFNLIGAGPGVRDFLEQTITHLEDIVDEDREPIPFSPDLLASVLDNYACRLALVNTYVAGVAKAKSGN